MKFWSKRKKWAVILFIVILVSSFFIFFTAAAVSFSHIDFNKNDLIVGDQFIATAYVTDWKNASIITVFIDDELIQTCIPGPTCVASFVTMPFDIGEHTYTFVATDKKGKTSKSGGTFSVQTDIPELVGLTTNSNSIPVGGAFFVKLDAKSKSPITAVKLSIDGVLTQYCLSVPCVGYIGPFTSLDEGQHTYTFEVTNAKGKTISPGGLFTVIPGSKDNQNDKDSQKTAISLPEIESIKMDKKDVPVGESATFDIAAKDEKGIISVMVYIDGKYAGGCDKKIPCSVKTAPFGESDIGPHNYKIIVVNTDGKKAEAEGSFWVVPKKKESSGSNAASSGGGSASGSGNQQPAASTPTGGSVPSSNPIPNNPVAPNPAQAPAASTPVGGKPAPTSSASTEAGSKSIPVPVQPPAQPTPVQPPAAKKTSVPEIEYVTTQGNQLPVGDTFSAKVFAKDEIGMYSILGYIDGKLVSTCEKMVVCPIKKGPLTENDIGVHSYMFIARNVLGKTAEVGGTFVVFTQVSATAAVVPPTAPTSTPGATPKPVEPLWIDTDGGINESVIGQCTSNVKGAPYQKYVEDYCIDKKQLNEYYVDEKADKCLVKQITCGGVCYQGLCYKAGSRPGAGYTPPAEPPSRPGAGYEPPSRPGAGYTPPEPPSRPGAGYTPPTEPPSRPGAGYTPPSEPPSRPGAAYTPPTRPGAFIPLWIDTDNGINEWFLGQCISNVIGASVQKYLEDYCVDTKQLNEYYVDEKADKCLNKQITCEGKCYAGICYTANSRPGASYTPVEEPPSRPGAAYVPPTETEEPPSRQGASYIPPSSR